MKLLPLTLAAAFFCAASPAFAENGLDGVKAILEAERQTASACSPQGASLSGSIDRIEKTAIPETGRVIVVNIPTQVLTAYEDGIPVLESRAVIGDPESPTPQMTSSVSFVRFHPTWTVPESIVREKRWREKFAENPAFFSAHNFRILMPDGSSLRPEDASGRDLRGAVFVQQAGDENALGQVKLGLRGAGSIYLHDTNDPGAYEDGMRAQSHGCVRVEKAVDLAAWVLGISRTAADSLLESGDRENRTGFPSPVSVVFTYFTAWPDADGRVRYYDDVYKLDPSPCSGNDSDKMQEESENSSPPSPIWSEYETQ